MFRKLGSLLCIASIMFVFTQSASQATRPYISMEEKARQSPILFLGVLLLQEEKTAPVRENILYNSQTALSLKFSHVRHLKPLSVSSGTNADKWTPEIFAQGMNVYTWTPQKSACPSAILETGKRYIVFAEYDSSERFVLADSCRSIVDATTPDGIELAKKLENLKF